VARPVGSGEGEWGVGRNEWRGASLSGENGDRMTEMREVARARSHHL
jgi:hypothetical protein